MKKLIVLLMAIITVFALVSCDECESHTDSDKNGLCDECGAKVEIPCSGHKDTDLNGKCDECGVDYRNPCSEHSDTDLNGKCDTCGVDYRNPCSEHKDINLDGKCDTCGVEISIEIGNEAGLAMANAVISQLEKTKSFKAEFLLEIELGGNYWESGALIGLPVKENQDVFKGIAKFTLTASKTENGVNAVIIADVKSTDGENEEMETDLEGGIFYLYEGVLYYYDSESEAFFKEPLNMPSAEEMEALIEKLAEGFDMTEEEQNEILAEIGKYALTTFDVKNNKGQIVIDVVPMYKDFEKYIEELKTSDTIKDIINDILALADEELTIEALLEEGKAVYSMTLDEFLQELDKELTELYGTTLQGLYEEALNDEKIGALIVSLMLEDGYTEGDASLMLEQLKLIKIEELIPEELLGITVYDIFMSYATAEEGTEYPDIDTMFSMIEQMLGMSLGELVLEYDFPMADLKLLTDMFELRELNSRIDVGFSGLFNLSYVDFSTVLDMSVFAGSEFIGKKDELTIKVKLSAKIFDLSENEAEIEAPPTDKEYYYDIFDKAFYDENGNILTAYMTDGYVVIEFTDGDVQIAVFGDLSVLKSTSMVFDSETAIIYYGDDQIYFDNTSIDVSVTFDFENEAFSVLMPTYTKPQSSKVTIYYDPNFDCGYLENDEDYEKSLIRGNRIKNHPTPIPLESCYVFEGWYLDEDCTQEVTSTHKFEEDTILYAKWRDSSLCVTGEPHEFGAWGEHTPATCTKAAVYVRTCTGCGEKEYKEDTKPPEHRWSAWEIKEPTCTEKGTETRRCFNCEAVETMTHSQLGHSWSEWTEGHLMQHRYCQRPECRTVDEREFVNITKDCIDNGNIEVIGSFFGSDIGTLANGDWDDGAIAPKANQDFAIEITMDNATEVDRVYLKGHGQGTSVYVYIKYESEDEYTLEGMIKFFTNEQNSQTERNFPYVSIPTGEKITGVMFKFTSLSQPTEYIDEIALMVIPK